MKLRIEVFDQNEKSLGREEVSGTGPLTLSPATLGHLTHGQPSVTLSIHIHMEAETGILVISDFGFCHVSAFADSRASLSTLKVVNMRDGCRVAQLTIRRLDVELANALVVGSAVDELNVGIETVFKAARAQQKPRLVPTVTELRDSDVSRARIFVPQQRVDARTSAIRSLALEPGATAEVVRIADGSEFDKLILRAKVSGLVVEDSKVDTITFGSNVVVDALKVSGSTVATAFGCTPTTFPKATADTWQLCMHSSRNARDPRGYADAGYAYSKAHGQTLRGVLDRGADTVFRWSCGYGYRPVNTVISAATAWFVSGLAYWFLTLGGCGIDGGHATESKCRWFGRSLYFSAITLTTIGYGDFTPQSWASMLLASTEGVAGIVLLALLVFSLTKKYGAY